MAQPQETFEQDVAWTRLMAEWYEIHERVTYAVTFHRLMQQRALLGVPVQYERLFLRSPGGKKEKKYDRPRSVAKSRRGRLPPLRV